NVGYSSYRKKKRFRRGVLARRFAALRFRDVSRRRERTARLRRDHHILLVQRWHRPIDGAGQCGLLAGGAADRGEWRFDGRLGFGGARASPILPRQASPICNEFKKAIRRSSRADRSV